MPSSSSNQGVRPWLAAHRTLVVGQPKLSCPMRVQVTPSSKVVGDLAQFMVAQKLEPEQVIEQAESLPFPDSVVSYLQGAIGVPPGGFPEPLRTRVLASRSLADGSKSYEGRPGATMPDYDFESAKQQLLTKYPAITDQDVLSYAMYPQVRSISSPLI